MDRATLDRLKARDFEFDSRHEELADRQTKYNLEREEAKKKKEAVLKLEKNILNQTEIGFVKFLFKIRNANNVKSDTDIKNKKHIIQNNHFFERNPENFVERERVFIAGKIFPIMTSIMESGVVADARKLKLKSIENFTTNFHNTKGIKKMFGSQYISIDDDNLKILLPKNYSGVNFGELMLDFLTNGTKTAHTIGGEFPDFETYKLALRKDDKFLEKNWKGEDGSWLLSDRANNTNPERWRNGYSYIIKHKIQGRLAPFKQIYDFYNAVDGWLFRLGHMVKWCIGAKELVKALAESPLWFNVGGQEGGSGLIYNDVETTLNELNLGICDYAITKFHELIYGKFATTPLKGDEAYQWDKEFITFEQGTVAPPIYNKTPKETINKLQNMVDKDWWKGQHGAGSWIFNDITPAFDDFDPPALITDNDFRIDLPLLMLYLDKHKPRKTTKSFAKHLNQDGTVDESVKKIIRDYVR